VAVAVGNPVPVAPEIAVPVSTRAGRRQRRLVPLMAGPAFVAAIAYVDPGNFATNIEGGSAYGYTLVWVVVLANIVAMLVQYLSAKLGLATGQNLAEVCRDRLPRPARWGMWAQAELVAIATDLAEFVGAAVALHLLFGLAPLPAGVVTALIAYLILSLRSVGRRPFEAVITALFAVILVAFAFEILIADPDWAQAGTGLVPQFAGAGSILLASGIVGATVMPHAVYVHSEMSARLAGAGGTPDRAQQRRMLRGQRIDVVAALGIAGLVNVSMLIMAASMFHGTGEVSGLEGAHSALAVAGGAAAATMFGIALLASGLSSASVGTCAGEVVMSGLLRRRVNPVLRRTVTMLPALVLLGLGADTGAVLVLSQVVLSFGIPFTLIPLAMLTSRSSVMGTLVNRTTTTVAAAVVSLAILALNGVIVHSVLLNG